MTAPAPVATDRRSELYSGVAAALPPTAPLPDGPRAPLTPPALATYLSGLYSTLLPTIAEDFGINIIEPAEDVDSRPGLAGGIWHVAINEQRPAIDVDEDTLDDRRLILIDPAGRPWQAGVQITLTRLAQHPTPETTTAPCWERYTTAGSAATLGTLAETSGNQMALLILRRFAALDPEFVDAAAADVLTELDAQDSTDPADTTLRFDGGLTIDLAAGDAHLNGTPLHLTRREYALAAFLARHPRRLFSRLELLEQVWGTQYQALETVTEHIRRIRTRLAPLTVISTVRGRGYRWDALPVEPSQ